MPINKFKFVSPGVQVAEIDNSQLPNEGVGSGPVIIGRAERGPAMRPVQVNSFSDFVNTFGMPWAGKDTDEIWRNGNKMAPSYGILISPPTSECHPVLTKYTHLLPSKTSMMSMPLSYSCALPVPGAHPVLKLYRVLISMSFIVLSSAMT